MHSPTLDSILMVERSIQRHSGKLSRYQLWKKLPKKMMYQTFQKVLQYLEESNKITVRGSKIHWSHHIAHHEIEVAKRVKPRQIHYVM